MDQNIYISEEIFTKFPTYCRGVVIAEGLTNAPAPEELVEQLRAAEEKLRGQLSLDKILEQERLASWREAYRSLGIKPSEFRPSVEGLARRALKNDPLPAINRIVDIGNLASLQHLVPVGAHAIDVIAADMGLRFATGKELFEPFGAELVEHPMPNEIIFAEGDIVLTRRWTWRQAKHTLVTMETQAVEINVDGLPPVSVHEVEEICDYLVDLVQEFCGGKAGWKILSPENANFRLSVY